MELSREPAVYIVHCVDAEGPLFESLDATFERIDQMFSIQLAPSQETLIKLQRCEIDLGGQEEAVARAIAPHLLEYNDTWDKINTMLEHIGSDNFRLAFPDSNGEGWVYNWHCIDHVGYVINPRRRDIGYHNIFDAYQRFIRDTHASDGLHWHFHPSHPSLAAQQSGTFYLRDTKFFDILARRLIDRHWFPSINRAGFHTERPDSHWLLEQWIPFDISNQACDTPSEQADLANGRFGDWRRAPKDWSIYQPDPDDYQIPGSCRRYIARCLNVGTRHRLLDEMEVRRAFERARCVGATLMAFTDHDFRHMEREVDYVRTLLQKVIPDYPGVRYYYSEAREAMNRVIFGEFVPPAQNILSATLESGVRGGTKVLRVTSTEPTFGSQPFLAIRTRSGTYFHDNFDFQEPFRHWTYVFDDITFSWDTVDCVAVATNDRRGFAHVVRIENDERRAVRARQ